MIPRAHRRHSISPRVLRHGSAIVALWLWVAPAAAIEVPQAPPAAGERIAAASADSSRVPLRRTLTRIEFEGLGRTSRPSAERATGLTLPTEATPERIQSAIDRLRESRLFESVSARTRPDESGEGVVLVFDVHESRPALRFGLGYEDFSSWYLIPAQLAFDNVAGSGVGVSASARIGYRVSGVDLAIRRPALRSAREFWEVRLHGDAVDRVYYLDSTETQHRVERGGLDLRFGRALGPVLSLEGWVAAEEVRVDSTARVLTARAGSGRARDETVEFLQLPAAIQRDVRDRPQSRVGLALVLDRRTGEGLETRGVWARASGEGAFSERGDFASWQADVRGYTRVGSEAQLALRLRAASLSRQAPFYERYYVGGLYTVRGYASQVLSPPEGVLNLGAGSIELRSAWLGPPAAPRFTAIAFLDGATGWNHRPPGAKDAAWGLGFGFRVRVPWLGSLGVDAARPLSPSPLDEAFHLNGSIGWTF